MKVFLCEDDENLGMLLREYLQAKGYDTDLYPDGEAGFKGFVKAKYDLCIVDVMMPKIDGVTLVKEIRSINNEVPVIFLTAKNMKDDILAGFKAGADDYITKPFSPSELMARVRAVLRRAQPSAASDVLSYGGLVMDLAAHRVLRNGKHIHLGPTEFRLLKFLMERPGRVYSREQLLDAVWGQDIYVEPRTVDVHIRRLRKAINGPTDADLIRTVRSAGYALDEMSHPYGAAESPSLTESTPTA